MDTQIFEMRDFSDRAEQPLSRLRILGQVAERLKSCNETLIIPEDVLELIGKALGASGVILVQKLFKSEAEFHLDILRMWAAYDVNGQERKPFTFNLEAIRGISEDREIEIQRGKPILFSPNLVNQPDEFGNLLLTPLLLEGDLFGYLVGARFNENSPSDENIEFALAVRHVFELWLANVNVEKRLKDVSNFIPDPTYLMNKKGEVTLWNKATEKMTGWKAERILGRGNYENSIPFYGKRRVTVPILILNPDPVWESDYLKYRKTGDDVFSLAYCPALPGGGAFLTCKTSILYDLNRRQWGCVHTVRDVTHERKMEIDLHRSKYIYETISDSVGIGIAIFQDKRIISYNKLITKIFGLKNGPVNTDSFLDLINRIHLEDRRKTSININRMLAVPDVPMKFQFRIQVKDAMRHFRCHAQHDDYSDKPTVISIFEDITHQVSLSHKARINELRMFHEDRLSALGVMATGIAHELNQPLNTVRVIADSFSFGQQKGWPFDIDEITESFEMISRQVLRMTDVIQNIRIFERNDLIQDEALINPNEAINNVFSMIGRQLEVHGIHVHKDFSPNLPEIKTTLSKFEQIIMNLVVNARQALGSSNKPSKQLWVRSYSTEHDLIFIEVEDNGTGIPEDMMVKIFDPFFTTKEVGQGTGLGLTVCNSILSMLNGSIDVYNNKKGGATFVVVIPSARGK